MFKKKNWDFWRWVTLGVSFIFLIFIIYPIASLFFSSFRNTETGAFSLEHFARFFSNKYYYQTLINSLFISTSATICSILIGVPLAYFMTSYHIKGKSFIEVIVILSMLSPPFIGAYSWILLLGRSGIVTQFFLNTLGIDIGSIYGFKGILLVFSLKLFPFIYLYVSGALKKLDVSLLEAGESLGCAPFKKITTLLIPLITPTILASSLLVFMNSMADFGTPMLIGEGYRVMPVVIYGEFVGEVGGEANFAAALASMMTLLTTSLFAIQRYIVEKKSFVMSSLLPIRPTNLKGWKCPLTHILIYTLMFLAILPQIVVIFTSFIKTEGSSFVKGFSFQSYETVFRNTSSAIINTFLYSFIAIICIIILGIFIAYISIRRKNPLTRALDALSMVPYIIPGSVLGITLLLAFNKPPLILSGTIYILIISYVIRRLPYTLRSSAGILHQLSPSVEEAAISLGSSPLSSFFKVTLIMMIPGILSGAILSWITVINELSSSVILYTGWTRTMSIAIYTEVIRASYGTAAALSTILTLSTAVLLILFFKLSKQKISII